MCGHSMTRVLVELSWTRKKYQKKMQCPNLSKISWNLVNIACVVAVLLQLGFIIEGFIKPTLLNISEEEIELNGIDFPIKIEICASPGFNETALEEMGYAPGIWNYFFGRSRFNSSIVGWAGHTADFDIIASVEEVYNLSRSYNIQDVMTSSWVTFKSDNYLYLEPHFFHPAERVNYAENCFRLNLTFLNEMDEETMDSLEIHFNTTKIEKAQINLYGMSLAANREIYDNTFESTGDQIYVTQPRALNKYAVEIAGNSYVEEDESKNCQNYPNSEYASYKECDDDYMQATCKSVKLTPLWSKCEEMSIKKSFFCLGY